MTGAASDRPEHGVRYVVVLDEAASSKSCAVYTGYAHLPDASHALSVTVALDQSSASVIDPDGVVDAELRARLEKSAAALVRAASRAELAEGLAPPRKIVRWRPAA